MSVLTLGHAGFALLVNGTQFGIEQGLVRIPHIAAFLVCKAEKLDLLSNSYFEVRSSTFFQTDYNYSKLIFVKFDLIIIRWEDQ